jgi:hypothetical protein
VPRGSPTKDGQPDKRRGTLVFSIKNTRPLKPDLSRPPRIERFIQIEGAKTRPKSIHNKSAENRAAKKFKEHEISRRTLVFSNKNTRPLKPDLYRPPGIERFIQIEGAKTRPKSSRKNSTKIEPTKKLPNFENPQKSLPPRCSGPPAPDYRSPGR